MKSNVILNRCKFFFEVSNQETSGSERRPHHVGSLLISASVQRVVGHRLISTKSANVSEPATLKPLRLAVVI
jgi:hypothetical protein